MSNITYLLSPPYVPPEAKSHPVCYVFSLCLVFDIKYKTSCVGQSTSQTQYIFSSIEHFTGFKGYFIFLDLWYILRNFCIFWCTFWMTKSNSPTLHPHHLHQWHLWQEDQGAVWVFIWEVRLLDMHTDVWEMFFRVKICSFDWKVIWSCLIDNLHAFICYKMLVWKARFVYSFVYLFLIAVMKRTGTVWVLL